jgi:hypothetical protein
MIVLHTHFIKLPVGLIIDALEDMEDAGFDAVAVGSVAVGSVAVGAVAVGAVAVGAVAVGAVAVAVAVGAVAVAIAVGAATATSVPNRTSDSTVMESTVLL